ncbi:hypothetical protein C6I20_16665 [Aeromicrobium sp. A1-2]|uniref:GOLPH3/VPS74 family protein n=1 Tax=Aeromicrobium sp. A1-2 TaxID=2107713 RepID=UPI000E4D3815|nr:GPP34 family phosphoprotein [Aeromicrobium sp. A1-2]AXT86637.1 hypothetical protein C6I20_16665 [Aeromicrobium sp. A1-2]
MSTAEDVLLIVTDPSSGKPGLDSMKVEAVLGGAHLMDLVTSGHLGLEGKGRKARVVVTRAAPVADPILAAAFARVQNRRRQAPQNVVSRLGKQGRKTVYAALIADGRLARRPAKALGIFPLTRYDVIDTARRDDLLNRIRASLLHDQPADSETGPVIGLLAAADLTRLLVDKSDRRLAKARAKVIAEGDWASEGVRQAIQAAQTVLNIAMITASATAVSGSS